MKKTLHTFFALFLLIVSTVHAQEANFSGISDGQLISIDAGTINLTADNNTTGTFTGAGVTYRQCQRHRHL
jgi:hypothetical protein